MRSNTEHLSEACRTSQTLEHATDKSCRSLPLPCGVCTPYINELHVCYSPPLSRSAGRPMPATRQSNTCLIYRPNTTTFGRMSDSDTPDAGSDRTLRSADSVLTPRQTTILDVIRASVSSRGYPPSIREIGDAVGLTSTSSVAHQLRALEKKGYLRRDPNRPRAVDVRSSDDASKPPVLTDVAGSDALPEPTYVPVLGRIAAGGPILAEEAVEDVFPLPRELVGEGALFLLKVVGESMVDA